MSDIFALEPGTVIDRRASYILSYPYLLSYFAAKPELGVEDVVRGAHMVYGWMPTVLELHARAPDTALADAAELLNRAKQRQPLADPDIERLAGIVNHSLVGASKLLHFVAPHTFPIWDSKIYAFMFRQRAYNDRVARVESYRK